MRTVLLASLRTYARRYVAAGIAVTVAVGFVVAIGVLASGALVGIMDRDGSPFRNADLVVAADPASPPQGPACCPELMNPAVAIDLVNRLGDNASATGRVELPAHTQDGRPLGVGDSPGRTTAGPIAAAQDMRWQKVVAGRFPSGPGEAVMHVWDAQAGNVAVGDRIRVGSGAAATDLRIVGLVESPSTWTQASLYVTWGQYLRWRDQPTFHVGEIAVRGDVGALPPGTIATPALRYVTDSLTTLNNGTDAFALMGVVFAGAALLVSALVIANTFSIMLAHRVREFALLRCVGATRRQVTASVRREAAAVGVLASLTGTMVGVALGYGAVALVGAVAPGAPIGYPGLPVAWMLGGFAVGVLVTIAASWLPTRVVVRVHPLAALRPQAVLDPRTTTGRARLALAALLLAVGVALLAIATVRGSDVAMVAGGGAFFVGVLLVGPALVPPLVRLVGAVFGRAGRLATRNAVRNPRRTATTTAALMVGVTLTTAVLTGITTWRTAMDSHRDTRTPIDATLTSVDRPLPAGLLEQVRHTPGVAQAVAVSGTVARISGWNAPIAVVAAPDAARVARDGGRFARVPPGTIVLDHEAFRGSHSELGRPVDGRVTVRAGDRTLDLKAVLLEGWGKAAVVAPETLAQLTDSPSAHVIWVRAADDADPLHVLGALDDVAGGAGVEISDRIQARAVGERQLDVLTWALLAFIGVSVVVAVVGIANTLGLSALERARENALLRALGMTRSGLRRMLGTEVLLLTVVATGLGTVIGVGFAWVAYRAVVKPALAEAAMVVPWSSLGVAVLVAVVAGLLAAVLPARRAARVAPAAGLSPD